MPTQVISGAFGRLRALYDAAPRSRGLRISFDLDDTLTGLGPHAPVESGAFPHFLQRHLGESLRHGTRTLIRELRRHGHSVWIYTTSGRSPERIRRWLLLHGIRVDGIVNDERHHRAARVHGARRWPSKFPPAFGIDLHVDDSEGVAMEGAAHGFRVLVISPDDPHWCSKVLDAANSLPRAAHPVRPPVR